MILEAFLAYAHYLSFILLIGCLIFEWVIYEKSLSARRALQLMKADGLYGFSATSVVATGLIKAFYFGKGSAYYFSNHIFNTKLSLLIIIGLLSIYPTIKFLKWRKPLKSGMEKIEIDEVEYSITRRIIRLELILVFIIPLLAALMARGIGFTTE